MSTPSPSPSPPPSPSRFKPWVQIKYFSFHPSLYPRMVGKSSGGGKPGDRVHVYDKNGEYFGTGFHNPKARVPVRMFHHGKEPAPDGLLEDRLRDAVAFRHEHLGLDTPRGACRLVHSDGDGIPGLVVDRFGEVLSLEVSTLAVWKRLPEWIPLLVEATGARSVHVQADPTIARIEGMRGEIGDQNLKPEKINEHGVRYEVDFAAGHKTGFFCDQRENRRRLGEWTQGRRVLDLCCYTGGFALAAKILGKSEEVTAVDLDEKSIAQALRNANLNETRLKLVHGDAFTWARQMQSNGTRWPVVVLDPPKFVVGREERERGMRKYADLNQLALSLVEPGGLFVTCSCSGLVSAQEFEETVIRSSHRLGRPLQILDRTGAGPDHPTRSNCPETRYLKVLWTRPVA